MFIKKANVLLVAFLGLNFSHSALSMSYIRSCSDWFCEKLASAENKMILMGIEEENKQSFSRVQASFLNHTKGTQVRPSFSDVWRACNHIKDNNYNCNENVLEHLLTLLRAWDRRQPNTDYIIRHIEEMEAAIGQKRQNKNKKRPRNNPSAPTKTPLNDAQPENANNTKEDMSKLSLREFNCLMRELREKQTYSETTKKRVKREKQNLFDFTPYDYENCTIDDESCVEYIQPNTGEFCSKSTWNQEILQEETDLENDKFDLCTYCEGQIKGNAFRIKNGEPYCDRHCHYCHFKEGWKKKISIIKKEKQISNRKPAGANNNTIEDLFYKKFGLKQTGDKEKRKKEEEGKENDDISLEDPNISENLRDIVYNTSSDQVQGIIDRIQVVDPSFDSRPKKIILHGVPGTGKSTISKLIAAETGRQIAFIRCASVGTKMQNSVKEKINGVDKIANRGIPCVIVFDEVDSLIAENPNKGDGTECFDQLIAQKIDEHLDKDVIFIFTTNELDRIDKRMRSRLSRHTIEIGLPNAPARRRILQYYCRKANIRFGDLEGLVRTTQGFTQRDLKETVKEAHSSHGAKIIKAAREARKKLLKKQNISKTIEMENNATIIDGETVTGAFRTIRNNQERESSLKRWNSKVKEYSPLIDLAKFTTSTAVNTGVTLYCHKSNQRLQKEHFAKQQENNNENKNRNKSYHNEQMSNSRFSNYISAAGIAVNTVNQFCPTPYGKIIGASLTICNAGISTYHYFSKTPTQK